MSNTSSSLPPADNSPVFGKLTALFREAVSNVPALKYTWGIVASSCIIALIGYLRLETVSVPLKSFLIILGLTLLVFLFSFLTKVEDRNIRIAVYILIYAMVCSIAVFICSFPIYLFTGHPKIYSQVLKIEYPTFIDDESMQLTVYIRSEGNQMEIVRDLEGKGRLIVDFDNDRRDPIIGENGRTNMGEIPLKFRGKNVPILLESDDYEAIAPDTTYFMNGKPVYFKVAPKLYLRTIEGSVRDSASKVFLDSALVVCNGEKAYSDGLGYFKLIMPPGKQETRYELTVFKDHYETETVYYTPKSTKADIRLKLIP